jgi:hypothetical protein
MYCRVLINPNGTMAYLEWKNINSVLFIYIYLALFVNIIKKDIYDIIQTENSSLNY